MGLTLRYSIEPVPFDRYYELDYVAGMGYDPGPTFRQRIMEESMVLQTHGQLRWFVVKVNDAPNPVVAYVAGCFLQDWALEELLNADNPYPNPKFVRWVREGMQPFELPKTIGKKNAGEGLNFIVTHFAWDRTLSLEQAAYVRSHAMVKFAEFYAGMKYKRMILEACSNRALQDALNAGYVVANTYPNWTGGEDLSFRPNLMMLDRDRALRGSNYFLMRVFSYQDPIIRFSETQRDLLLLARIGRSDEEIADLLCISMDAVKDRWKKIYARTEDKLPSLLPLSPNGIRGPEKRKTLMGYLEDHPSEFWPFDQ